MSVLDRVKAFLPDIQAANDKLNVKILASGAKSVQIDGNLGTSGGGGEGEGDVAEESMEQQAVALEFALGDFEEEGKLLEGKEGEEDEKEMKSDSEALDDDEDEGEEAAEQEGKGKEVIFHEKLTGDLLSVSSTTRKRKSSK